MSQSSSSVGSFGLSDLAEIKFPESGAGLTIPQSVPGRADQVIE